MNCNLEAFEWIIDFVKLKTSFDDKIEVVVSSKQIEELKY
jgi:DNA polymerase III delta prime subunit